MEFVNFNANPKNKRTGDCVIRALCTGLGKSWEITYKELFENCIKTGYAISSKENYSSYLKENGYCMEKMPRRKDNTRYTVREFANELANTKGIYILKVANHVTLIKDKKLYDTWNCGNKSVGNYWKIK